MNYTNEQIREIYGMMENSGVYASIKNQIEQDVKASEAEDEFNTALEIIEKESSRRFAMLAEETARTYACLSEVAGFILGFRAALATIFMTGENTITK